MSIHPYLSKEPLTSADLAAVATALGLGPRAAGQRPGADAQGEGRARGQARAVPGAPMSLHSHPSPLAGSTVTVDMGRGPEPYRVEDWWDRVSGGSWTIAAGNLAALNYAMRAGFNGKPIPLDDEVLYGKDDAGFGHLVHVNEVLAQEEASA